mmetsp:Transcript_8690/g.20330  ORF Transcript_8690/g.20330 Transcript_8690/m.20330 type:complete len:323 (-) Transcript_8690:305-1273(-)
MSSASGAKSGATCAHCGKEEALLEVDLKRCLRCKRVAYCSKECQKAGWKTHKNTCRMEVDLKAVDTDIAQSIVGCADDEARCHTLEHCAMDHWAAGEYEKAARYIEWVTDFLGCMERFRDQGRAMCRVAEQLRNSHQDEEAHQWATRARDLGVQHGFFQTEMAAVLQLAEQDIKKGRLKEGVDQLRHALTVTRFCEDENEAELLQRNALHSMMDALEGLAMESGEEQEEQEEMITRFQKAIATWSCPGGCNCGIQTFEFLGHDYRVLLLARRGDEVGAAREMKAMLELVMQHTEVFRAFAERGASCSPSAQLILQTLRFVPM